MSSSIYKQSLILLVIRILSFIISIFTLIYVTSKMTPLEYSILGVCAMYNGMSLLLSNFGFESILSRNYLSWKDDSRELIDEFFSFAVNSKILLGFVIFIILALLSFYYWEYNYNKNYSTLCLLILGAFSSFIFSIGNSLELSIISTGSFIYVNVIRFVFGPLLKLLFVLNYDSLGAFNYVLFVQTTMVFPLIFYIFYIKRMRIYSFSGLNIQFFYELRIIKHYFTENYLRYIGKSLDQFIVSLYVPAELFSTYSLIKTLETLSVGLIDNFFDPLTQNLVRYRNSYNLLTLKIKNIIITKSVLGFIIFLFTIVFYFLGSSLFELLGLSKYPYLYEFTLCVGISVVLYMLLKVELSIICLFLKPCYRVLINLISIINILVVLILCLYCRNYIAFSRISYSILVLISTFFIYYSKRGLKYEKNIYRDV